MELTFLSCWPRCWVPSSPWIIRMVKGKILNTSYCRLMRRQLDCNLTWDCVDGTGVHGLGHS